MSTLHNAGIDVGIEGDYEELRKALAENVMEQKGQSAA